MQGWFKLYRKIINSPVFNDPHILRLWMLCLSKATHKEREILVGKQQVNLLPGEFVTGRDALSLEYNMGLSPRHHVKSLTIWRWLKALEEWGNVNIKSTTKYSVISIVNWGFYQDDEQQNDQQMISKCTTNDQQMITNKNDKNDKKKEYTPEFESFWDTYPRKKEKAKAFKCWSTRLKEEGVTVDILLQCTKNYAAEVKRKGTQDDYIKLPATFLGPSKPYEDYKNIKVTELKPKQPQNDFLAKFKKMEEEARASKSGS